MLTRKQLKDLHRGLLDTFSPSELDEVLVTKLGIPIDLIADKSLRSETVFEVIQAAERAGWTQQLVQGLFEAQPDNLALAELYEDLGLAPDVTLQEAGQEVIAEQKFTASALERLTHVDQTQFLDIAVWRQRLTMIESRVCRVEVAGMGARPMGTGFLVGPDLVLTAYHVVQPMFENRMDSNSVRCRFDYRTLVDGISQGVIVDLHPTDWQVDFSRYAGADLESSSDSVPTLDELDYALLRLARTVGTEPGDPSAKVAALRGWLSFPQDDPIISPEMSLIIAQYVQDGPLKIAIDTKAHIRANENGNRIFYATNTYPGAGGAPCFNANLELVAMHQGGIPINKGIPIAAIRDRLRRVGKAKVLAEPFLSHTTAPFRLVSEPPEPGPIVHADDPQKDRWGRQAERSGRILTVTIKEISHRTFAFDASVSSEDGSPLQCPVIFYLHDTYLQPVIWVRDIHDGKSAVLSNVNSYGVYTLGVQVKDANGAWLGLEFDLSTVKDLPTRFLSDTPHGQ